MVINSTDVVSQCVLVSTKTGQFYEGVEYHGGITRVIMTSILEKARLFPDSMTAQSLCPALTKLVKSRYIVVTVDDATVRLVMCL